MKLSTTSQALIQQTIRHAVGTLGTDTIPSVITDIHLQPNPISGEFTIFDDEDSVLAQVIIEEWIDCADKDFYKKAESTLRSLLSQLKDKGEFENTPILAPFSFVLLDEDKETITDLFLIDDDTVLVNEELLKGLDEELDSFLKDLLEN